MSASDAIPVPRKNVAYRFYFGLRKPSDSTLITSWTGQDSEVDKDGAGYADCTNEATEIGTSGSGYIDLTATEMNADHVFLKITITNTGSVTYLFDIYPETAGDYRVSDTQKVDIETIKTQTVTCAAGVTVPSLIASTTNITAGIIASVSGAVGSVTGSVGSVVGITAADIGTILGKFSGITLLADWLRRLARKDAGTAGMIAAEAEIDTGGTSTFSGLTDSLEAIRDASGGGGGGGDATLANQVLILADLASITSALNATTVTVTGYASIDTDGVLQLKRAETATLTFTSDSADLVPDLSVADTKIILGIKDTAGRVWLSLEGTVLVATGLQSVRFVLTPALSLALINGHHNFDVLAVYGYDAELIPPYASLKTFTSGRVTVTDVFLDPLEL